MGRTERSQGLAPPAIRKDMRAKQARHIVNKVVPALLASNTRARKGADGSELIINPGPVSKEADKEKVQEKKTEIHGGDEANYVKRKGQGRRKAKNTPRDTWSEASKPSKGAEAKAPSEQGRLDEPQPSPPMTLRILTADTLTAAHALASKYKSRKDPNPCILNMASPLRPGGGVLAGATSQEEYLCARTTLLPSLRDAFYRLPELGGVYTRDVLVFRNHLGLGHGKGELPPPERWWVDVVSAGMLRFPDLEGGEEEEKRLHTRDRALVEAKMRAVLRMACCRGVKKLVLGAWGCGAYGNPVRDVAEAWRTVLVPSPPPSSQSRKGKMTQPLETWDGLQEVVFAISNKKMAHDFARAFGGGIEVEAGPDAHGEEEEEDETDEVAEELRSKITEMDGQIEKVWNPDLKHRLGIILDGLKTQLSEREGRRDEDGSEYEEDHSEDVATPIEVEPSGVEEEVLHYSSDEWQVSPFD